MRTSFRSRWKEIRTHQIKINWKHAQYVQSALNGLNVRINHVHNVPFFLHTTIPHSNVISVGCETPEPKPDWVNLNRLCQLVKHKHKPNECISCSLVRLFGSWIPSILGICTPLLLLSYLFLFLVGLTRDCPNSRDLCENPTGWVDKRHYAYLFHRCTTLNLI